MSEGEIEPLVVHVRVRCADGATEELADRLLAFREETLSEPGCLGYELHRSAEGGRELMLYETWSGPEALEAHTAASHYAALEEEIEREGWVEEGPEITRWWPVR